MLHFSPIGSNKGLPRRINTEPPSNRNLVFTMKYWSWPLCLQGSADFHVCLVADDVKGKVAGRPQAIGVIGEWLYKGECI